MRVQERPGRWFLNTVLAHMVFTTILSQLGLYNTSQIYHNISLYNARIEKDDYLMEVCHIKQIK